MIGLLLQSPAQDAMESRARLFAIALGVAVLLFVVNLVRTRKLKEEFALLWLLTAVVLVLAPLLIDYLDMLAHALGIEYPPAFIFVLAIISVLLILFQFSIRISHFSEQIKVLTQELALLRARLEFLERSTPQHGTGPGPGPGGTSAPAIDEEEMNVRSDNDTQVQ